MKTVRYVKLNGKHVAQFDRAQRAAESRRMKAVLELFYVIRTYPSGRTFGEFHAKDISQMFEGFGCKTRSVLVVQ